MVKRRLSRRRSYYTISAETSPTGWSMRESNPRATRLKRHLTPVNAPALVHHARALRQQGGVEQFLAASSPGSMSAERRRALCLVHPTERSSIKRRGQLGRATVPPCLRLSSRVFSTSSHTR